MSTSFLPIYNDLQRNADRWTTYNNKPQPNGERARPGLPTTLTLQPCLPRAAEEPAAAERAVLVWQIPAVLWLRGPHLRNKLLSLNRTLMMY